MKLSELRPCDNCGGAVAPMFYVVRASIAVFNPGATNEVLGLMRMFHNSLTLAEAMSSKPEAVMIGGEEEKSLWVEIYLCQDCYVGDVNLAVLAEKIAKRNEQKSEVNDGTE